MISGSLADMETRYNKAVERTALLEEELLAKDQLEEENQRLKDEVRGENPSRSRNLEISSQLNLVLRIARRIVGPSRSIS